MKKISIILLFFFFLIGMSLSLYCQQQAKPELRKEIVQVKYLSVYRAMSLLRPYMSRSFPGPGPMGKIQDLPERNALIIEDTPEVVEKLLSILKELDVKPLDLQFTADVILGSLGLGSSLGITVDEQKELMSDPVIRELNNFLKYKSFKRLDSSIIKVQDNTRSIQRIGGGGISLQLNISPRFIKEEKADTFLVELTLSKPSGIYSAEGKEGPPSTLLSTTLSLKSGERTVVGVSKLNGGDKALILILSGKVIK
jgi:hypothetical protein